MKVISTNIGERQEIIYKNKKVTTGIFKYPVDEPIFVDIEEVKGDEISDRKHHGGADQAVYAYSFTHYQYWKSMYPNLDWNYGMFGENLTVDDIEETQIHVGDTFKVGDAIIEATLQRSPCYKLGIRFDNMKIVKQFWKTTMCGVYFKVLQVGNIQTGDIFEQIKSCTNKPTIADLLIQRRKELGVL